MEVLYKRGYVEYHSSYVRMLTHLCLGLALISRHISHDVPLFSVLKSVLASKLCTIIFPSLSPILITLSSSLPLDLVSDLQSDTKNVY